MYQLEEPSENTKNEYIFSFREKAIIKTTKLLYYIKQTNKCKQ